MHYTLFTFLFTSSPQHFDTEEQQNFLKLTFCCMNVAFIWQNDKEFLTGALVDSISSVHVVHHFITHIKLCASLSFFSVATFPLKRDLPQPMLERSMSNRYILLI